MSDKAKYSGIYERLVEDDHDFLGQVAYSIYKRRKCEFIVRKKADMNIDNVPDDIVADFIRGQTDYTLDLYRSEAQKLSREFLDASYEAELSEAVQYLDTQYREKYEQLAKEMRPQGFMYGVWQGVLASFIFFAAGILLLLATGGWTRIGQALIQLAQ